MSQHAIEDLVEQTIRLIDAGGGPSPGKASLIRGLLRLQARYDTSLTWFRLPEILLRHGVLQRQSLAEITDPDIKPVIAAAPTPGWASTAAGDPLGYLRSENGTTVLYRETEAIPLPALPALFLAIARLADDHDDTRLLTDWYGLMVQAWANHELGEADGFPRGLDALADQSALCAIREIAARRQLKPRRGAAEDLALPRLAEELPADVEREYALRFFLDLRKPVDTLRKAQAKAAERHHASAVLIPALIETRLAPSLQQAGWQPQDAPGELSWRWQRDVGDQHQLVWCEFDARFGALICQMGLQHRLLLRWQQRGPSEQLHDLHFYAVATRAMPEAVLAGKQVDGLGGWRLDPGKSAKVLTASVEQLAELLPDALDAWFAGIATEFPDVFFRRDVDELLELMIHGVDGSGVIPDHVLFANPDSLLLAFAFHHLAAGDATRAEAMVDRVRQRLSGRARRNVWIDRYLVPFLDGWAAGWRDLPMPPVVHTKLALHLR